MRCNTVLISQTKWPGNSTKHCLLSVSKTSASRRLTTITLYKDNRSSVIDWYETLYEYSGALIQLPAWVCGKQHGFCSHLISIAKRMAVNPLPVVPLSDTEVKDAKWQLLPWPVAEMFQNNRLYISQIFAAVGCFMSAPVLGWLANRHCYQTWKPQTQPVARDAEARRGHVSPACQFLS